MCPHTKQALDLLVRVADAAPQDLPLPLREELAAYQSELGQQHHALVQPQLRALKARLDSLLQVSPPGSSGTTTLLQHRLGVELAMQTGKGWIAPVQGAWLSGLVRSLGVGDAS